MEQEEETGGIDECYEIAGESLGLIRSVQKDASAKDASAKDDFDYESDEDGSDTNEGKYSAAKIRAVEDNGSIGISSQSQKYH